MKIIFEQEVKSFGLENLLVEVTSGIVRKENYYQRPKDFIAISVYGPGVKVIETYKDGKLSSWECACCHNRDGNHSPTCLINNESWKKRYTEYFGKRLDSKNPFEDPNNNEDNISKTEGIIFVDDKDPDPEQI